MARKITYYLTLILLAIATTSLQAQQTDAQPLSYNGNVHTPKGELKVLFIFVRYIDKNLKPNAKELWPNKTQKGVLPKMAIGKNNELFDQDPQTIGQAQSIKNLSDFYYQMSGGKFKISAEIFPVQVPIKFVPQRGNNFFSRQGAMNKAAIEWIADQYPDFDWSRYDQRTNNPNYLYDNTNSQPDSILDYVVFMHRAPGNTGMGNPGNISIPNTPYKIISGHTGIKCYSDKEHNWEYFRHEFAHNLYSCPHYLGANGVCGTRYYWQKGWGMMEAWHSPFFTANAWECWWLGWLDQTQEVRKSGTYSLKDFVTQRDAIRIQIPGTQDYLWIENHQKKSHWDDKVFFNDPQKGHPQSAPGIYMYVVAEPGADRAKPKLSPFNKKHTNMIKMMNGEGNFDYDLSGDTIQTDYFPTAVWIKTKRNPFAGQNDFQGLRYDYNNDGKVYVNVSHGNKDKSGGEQREMWAEIIDGQPKYTVNCTGDEKDAFVLGSEVGLSGIVPVTNYPEYNKKEQFLDPFYINGITIKIVEQSIDGTYSLDIQFDDWNVRNNTRWCGNLLLTRNEGGQHPWLTISNQAKLQLDLGGTPDRETPHPDTKTFTNPTILKVEGNRKIRIQDRSRFVIKNYSTLELTNNAKLVIEKGTRLIIQNRGKLILKDNAQVIVKAGGRLITKSEGSIQEFDFARMIVEPKAKIIRE